MTVWKTTVLTGALVTAAAAGAAFMPPIHGQAQVAPAQHATVTQLLRNGSEIGVTIRDVSDADASSAKLPGPAGALIASVSEDGPASRAGMKTGDIITEFDGERIRGARQFSRVVEETPAGRKVQASLLRDGQRMTLTVQPRETRGGYRLLSRTIPRAMEDLERDFKFEFPTPPTPPAPPAAPARPVIPDLENFFGRSSSRLGISVDELSSQLADYFGTKDGVLVTSVTDNSIAAKAGLKAGDVITSFNGEPVTSASELRRRIQRLDSGAAFTIGVMRDRKSLTLKGKLEEREERVRTYPS